MKVKNILFDLGGVIVDLDVQRTYSALKKMVKDGEMVLDKGVIGHPVFRQYEIGEIDSQTFTSYILNHSKGSTTTREIADAWNAMLLSIPVERIQMLEDLRSRYRLFILSNTNAIHEEKFEKMAPGYSMLRDLFESVYYSHHIGCRKPDAEAYGAVINGSGIQPSETLFVDDLEANIKTARELGFQTLQVTGGLNIVEWFKQNRL